MAHDHGPATMRSGVRPPGRTVHRESGPLFEHALVVRQRGLLLLQLAARFIRERGLSAR